MNPALTENAGFFRDSPPDVRASMLRTAQPAMLHAGEFFYHERELCPHFAYVLAGDHPRVQIRRAGLAVK